MYLLDTNIISETRRVRPHGGVMAWLAALPDDAIFVSAVTVGEIQSGAERIRSADPVRAVELEQWIERIVATLRVLPMDGNAFRITARLMVRRQPAIFQDAMIAATAMAHGLAVATRNVRDFRNFPIAIVDPFLHR